MPPKTSRPRLPEPLEAAVASADQRSAEAYDAAELACAKLKALAEGAARGAIVGEELEITDSLAHEIETVKP